MSYLRADPMTYLLLCITYFDGFCYYTCDETQTISCNFFSSFSFLQLFWVKYWVEFSPTINFLHVGRWLWDFFLSIHVSILLMMLAELKIHFEVFWGSREQQIPLSIFCHYLNKYWQGGKRRLPILWYVSEVEQVKGDK